MKLLLDLTTKHLGGLVESSIYYDIIVEKIKNFDMNVKEVEIKVNPQDVNNVVGYKKENINKLKETYDVDVKVVQDIKYVPGKIDVKILKNYKDFQNE